MLKGKLHMYIISKRLVSIAASTALVSLISTCAHAQVINALTGYGGGYEVFDGGVTSSYTFNKSMILNSIGFYTGGLGSSSLIQVSYSINGVSQSFNRTNLVDESGGISWLILTNPTTLQANSTVTVTTLGTFFDEDPDNDVSAHYETYSGDFPSTNPTANVTYNGVDYSSNLNLSNSNLRVSNPSANVAPEPGSFALALTGGAALIGICVRRRRNAG
jgi:hypothetical protein